MAISPGQLLRSKREEKKLTLEQAALETNIRIQYLQAIEEDRKGAISSQAQLRGFIRLYASYLGLNPLEILEPGRPAETTEKQVEIPEKTADYVSPSIKPAEQSNSDNNQKSLLDLAKKVLPSKRIKEPQSVQAPVVEIN
ncbi:helix-turn-helix domain-containing protein, partial [bacterium]|nr:helix-turn-helix domain-containing protein [bacterium]